MNDADDAESNKALALVVWQSGLVTWTWHVISKLGEYYWIGTCVLQLPDHLSRSRVGSALVGSRPVDGAATVGDDL